MPRISIGDYEFDINITEQDNAKHYQRELRIAVLDKNKKLLIRLDNCHPKSTGTWPIHIHIRDSKNRHYYLGSNIKDVLAYFSKETAKITNLGWQEIHEKLNEYVKPEMFIEGGFSEIVNIKD